MKNNDKFETEFNQKKINHIFHYTNSFEVLLKIIRNGFAPSYCDEKINEIDYYIPMVSFCNIPLKDVDLYMRYGKYGIGMSLEWAVRNSISPVIYIHENTPFKDLHKQINLINLNQIATKYFANMYKEITENVKDNNNYEQDKNLLKQINDVTVPTLQFFKNWKTIHKNKEIITYQEREWRYIPNLINEKRLITIEDKEFNELSQKDLKPKPHLPEYSLKIDLISDLRYLVIKTEEQRKKVMEILAKKFTLEKLTESILSGKFIILTEEQINNDF